MSFPAPLIEIFILPSGGTSRIDGAQAHAALPPLRAVQNFGVIAAKGLPAHSASWWQDPVGDRIQAKGG
jgi:hypothetical protein